MNETAALGIFGLLVASCLVFFLGLATAQFLSLCLPESEE